MNKRVNVLIWHSCSEILPKGGPSGYLYNLKDALKSSIINFEFLPDLQESGKKRNTLKKYFRRIFKLVLDLNTIKKILKSSYNLNLNINKYDIIHFHNTKDLYMARKLLEGYKGRILLTSHCPKPYHLEVFDDVLKLNKFQKIIYRKSMKELAKVDIYAFKKADFILFPCYEAEEPYINNWQWYKQFSKENRSKYIYIPTCIKQSNYTIGREDVLKKYGIPKDAKIICYVGRHNETKGYDLLKKVAKSILVDHENTYFLIAGKEEPLKRLNHPRWIEVGWTKDPHSIINASDIFILPNKETYFDLILLEVISLGKPIVLSNTGGNKYFKKYPNIGFRYFDNVDEAIQAINNLLSLNDTELQKLGFENRKIFNDYFRIENFMKKYEEIITNLS